MSFSIDKITHHYINPVSQSTEDNKRTESGGTEKKFDEVLITSSSRQIEEKKMSESMTKEVMSQVNQSASPKVLEQLKQKIEKGEYQVNIDEMAGRILLQRGEPKE